MAPSSQVDQIFVRGHDVADSIFGKLQPLSGDVFPKPQSTEEMSVGAC